MSSQPTLADFDEPEPDADGDAEYERARELLREAQQLMEAER